MVEALLRRKELFQEDFLVTVDLAVYESVNSIWKHQFLIKDLDDGVPYVSLLYGFIESGRIRVIHLGEDLMRRGYSLAARNKLSSMMQYSLPSLWNSIWSSLRSTSVKPN